MLTPAQIRSHKFISSIRGSYKAEEVDAFFEEVASSYEQAFRENAELIKKISLLAQKVEEYRADEDTIKSTLLTAQRVADEMIKDAQEKSEQMLQSATEKLEYAESSSKANAQIVMDEADKAAQELIFETKTKTSKALTDASKEAEELLAESKRKSAEQLEEINAEIQKETLCLEILKKEVSSFRDGLLAKYRQHMEFIDELPAVVAETIRPETDVEEDYQELIESATEVPDDGEDEAPDDDISADDIDLDDSSLEDKSEDFDQYEPELEPEDDNEDIYSPSYEDTTSLIDESQFGNKGIDEIEEFLFGSEEPIAENITHEEDLDIGFSDHDDSEAADIPPEKSENDDVVESYEVEKDEEDNSDNEENDEQVDGEKVEVSKDADENDEDDEDGLPNLFSLRKMAMAQQQELNATDTEPVSDNLDEDPEQPPSDITNTEQDDTVSETTDTDEDDDADVAEDDGFKVYLDNLDADDDILSGDLNEESIEKNSLFETVEYDDDETDEDGEIGRASCRERV